MHDASRRSYAYVLRASEGNHFSEDLLRSWFERLHPRNFGSEDTTAWSKAHYQGVELLRLTAWATLDPACECDYGYSDTWQQRATSPQMLAELHEIGEVVAATCGLSTCCAPRAETGHAVLNSVNCNYYPRGGGVGWHADDEFLFDSLRRDTAILSLSLCNSPEAGRRQFQVRLKKAFRRGREGSSSEEADATLVLGHGDVMTMEGLHQLFYLHSVWPGDSKARTEHALTQGERINLTWRTIVQHLDGGDECNGLRCPLAS